MKFCGLALLVFLASPTAMAQVYKCDGPDGPIFSDQECGPRAEVVIIDETSGLGGQVSYVQRVRLMEKKLYRAQGRYINRLYQHRDQDVKAIDSQIRALTGQKGQANNNLAGATYATGLDQQIAVLRGSRAQVTNSYREQIIRVELDRF
jgi:hypothetical protein